MVGKNQERRGGGSPPNLLPAPDYPCMTTVPSPGLCVMTTNPAGDMFYLNLCKLAEVPPAAAMEAAELEGVQMAVGLPRQERDKAGAVYWFDNTMKDSKVCTLGCLDLLDGDLDSNALCGKIPPVP